MEISFVTSESVREEPEELVKARDLAKKTFHTALDRLEHVVKEVRVTVYDDNATKGGHNDKRCTVQLQLRPGGRIFVERRGAKLTTAISDAAHTVKTLVTRMLGRKLSHSRLRGAHAVIKA